MNIMGCPVAPTIKMTGNPRTAQRMRRMSMWTLRNADGREKADAGARVLKTLLATASGQLTHAEIFGDEEIAIARSQRRCSGYEGLWKVRTICGSVTRSSEPLTRAATMSLVGKQP